MPHPRPFRSRAPHAPARHRILDAAHHACWMAATTGAVYLAVSLGVAEVARNPIVIAGLLLVGVGLLRDAKHRLAG